MSQKRRTTTDQKPAEQYFSEGWWWRLLKQWNTDFSHQALQTTRSQGFDDLEHINHIILLLGAIETIGDNFSALFRPPAPPMGHLVTFLLPPPPPALQDVTKAFINHQENLSHYIFDNPPSPHCDIWWHFD